VVAGAESVHGFETAILGRRNSIPTVETDMNTSQKTGVSDNGPGGHPKCTSRGPLKTYQGSVATLGLTVYHR
jgi:hypothetical protein